MKPALRYRSIRFGVETVARRDVVRHAHRSGYATVVLAGGFVEATFAGRHRVAPGEVIVHAAFDRHCNYSATGNALRILRLPWRDDAREGHFRVRDADMLVRAAERDSEIALRLLRQELEPVPRDTTHWTERLAQALSERPRLHIADWAASNGLTPEALSRGFRRAYGIAPASFRLEAATRRAWRALRAASSSLTVVAHDHGFADLAHMSRSVRCFTGFSPSAWRRYAGASG